MGASVLPVVAEQLAGITLIPGRPLLVVDADEVLLLFVAAFERFVESRGFRFDWAASGMERALLRSDDGSPAGREAGGTLIESFFVTETERLDPVPGAAETLAALSRRMQVVVVSNIPPSARAARQRSLGGHGMPYPVVANVGPKGPTLRRLARDAAAPTFFVDDLPANHQSVALAAESVHRIHLVADPRFARLLGPAGDAHIRAADWPAAAGWIEERLDLAGA